MREGRRREAERLVEQHLPRRVRDVILAADHMRHLHQRIVDDDGEVVGRHAVGADDHRIADDVGVEADVAADDVGEHDVAIAPGPGSGSPAARRRRSARSPARARAAGRCRRRARGGRRRAPPGARPRAAAVEQKQWYAAIGAEQLLRVRLIQVQALGLAVRAVRAADVRPLVPVEAEPPQIARGWRLPTRASTARRRCLRCAG